MPPHLDEHTREQLARAIHQDYVARAVANQDSSLDTERVVPFEDLSEESQDSNRSQADDLCFKLEMIGATIVPLDSLAATEFRFTSRELERLSRHEHKRWMHEKLQAGWRFGPTIDPVARTHPCLVGYNRLPEEEKEKDRHAVQRIPLLLRAVGLGIRRLRTRRLSKQAAQTSFCREKTTPSE
jgi:hypothetical protein